MQKQQLGDAIAAADQVGSHLLAAAAEVAGTLETTIRHGDRLKLAGEQQAGEKLRVLAVALDPLTTSRWCFARSDHIQT
jgi:hypothetical protein